VENREIIIVLRKMIPNDVINFENCQTKTKLSPQIIEQFNYIPLTVLECFDWTLHEPPLNDQEESDFEEQNIEDIDRPDENLDDEVQG
jgi:hypothetical protein